MAYTKMHDPWVNADSVTGGGDETTPLTAAAMDHIESGISTAASVADAATAAAAAAQSTANAGTASAAAAQSTANAATASAAAANAATGAIAISAASAVSAVTGSRGPAGGVLGGTYPNPSFAADMATQAELDAHINDTSAAHAAGSISVDSTTLVGTGTDVQAVFEEMDNAIAAISAASGGGGGSDDQTAAEVPFTPAGTVAATDVQAAIVEVSGDVTSVSATVNSLTATYQAKDADLTTWAGLTPTAFFQTLIDDADAATLRATIGVIASLFQSGGAQAIKIDDLAAGDDNTDLNSSTSKHGLLPKLDNTATHYLDGTGAWSTPAGTGGGGGSGTAVSITASVTAAHGFAVGDVIYRTAAGAFAKAKADAESTAEAIGIVSATASTAAFTYITDGEVTGLTGLTDGAVYYVSAATAGVLTATEPSAVGQISKPILIATGTTKGNVVNMRGGLISSTPIGGQLAYGTQTSDVALTQTAEASANTLVTASAFTANGTDVVYVEFQAGQVAGNTAGDYAQFWLYEGSTSLGFLGYCRIIASSFGVGVPVRFASPNITPATGTRTYSVRATRSGGNTMSVYGGAGGAGTMFPMHIRVVRVA